MRLFQHITALHEALHGLRDLAQQIDARIFAESRYRDRTFTGKNAPLRWPGAYIRPVRAESKNDYESTLGRAEPDKLWQYLAGGPLICGARQDWHAAWCEQVRAANDPVCTALLTEYDRRLEDVAGLLGTELTSLIEFSGVPKAKVTPTQHFSVDFKAKAGDEPSDS